MTSPASSVAHLLADPEAIDMVRSDQLPGLLGEIEALKAKLWARLQASAPHATPAPTRASGPDRLLTAEEVSDRLGVSKRWVYRKADGLPFTKRLSGGTLRFSERGLERWQARSS